MRFDSDSRICIPDHVLHRDLGTETVLLDLDNGVYYGLDTVGTRWWTILSETPRLGDLHRRLLAEFEVSTDRLWNDLTVFLAELNDKGLIDVSSGEAPKT